MIGKIAFELQVRWELEGCVDLVVLCVGGDVGLRMGGVGGEKA